MAAKTIAEKLQIKPNAAVWLSDGDLARLVAPLPEGARLVEELGRAGVAVVFVDGAATTRTILDEQRAALTAPGVFWVAYPKGNRADVNRDSLWPILADYGMRPISQVAIDDVWSALRFRPLKEGEARFTGGQ
jgi:hypothetical protein